MGKFAFVKVVDIDNSMTLDGITVDDAGLRAVYDLPDSITHWQRFGSNIKGWDLAYFFYPDYTTGNNLFMFDRTAWNLTVGDIPQAKRQAMNTWLTDNNYDTSWVTLSTTVQDVLKDIMHYLNEWQGIKEEVFGWAKSVTGRGE